MRRFAIPALAVLLLLAAPASADETITAHTPNQFSQPVTTIDQGEKVTFQNLDIAGHDVISKRKSDDGKPLFRSDVVEAGKSGPVVGTEYLTTGTYPFFCHLHPGMEATLEVTSSGTPVARPNPPQLSLKITSSDLQRVVRKRKLKVRVTSTKASVKLRARTKSGKLGSKTVTFDRAGTQTVAIGLTKSGRNRLRGRKSAKVTVTGVATDAAGQTGKATATRTLR